MGNNGDDGGIVECNFQGRLGCGVAEIWMWWSGTWRDVHIGRGSDGVLMSG